MSLTAGYTFKDGEDTGMAKKLNLAFSSASGYNGTVGATTPTTGAFTTLSASSTVDFAAGSVGTPSLRFGADTTSGIYRIGANNLGVSISGAKVLDIASTGLAVTGALSSTGKLSGNGTATNDNASAGQIGEYIESVITSGSAVSLSTGTPADVTSISLTVGDWDVWGVIYFNQGATTTATYYYGGVSSSSGAYDGTSTGNTFAFTGTGAVVINPVNGFIAPCIRKSLSGTTTIYLVADSGFSISTMLAYGAIRARRRR